MDAFKMIELVESKEAAEDFKKYFDGLKLTPEIRDKITVFDLTHPLYQSGFHPAFALHMIQYNDNLKLV